ncbi:hypothetical protein [Nocardia sp. NPDC004260]
MHRSDLPLPHGQRFTTTTASTEWSARARATSRTFPALKSVRAECGRDQRLFPDEGRRTDRCGLACGRGG